MSQSSRRNCSPCWVAALATVFAILFVLQCSANAEEQAPPQQPKLNDQEALTTTIEEIQTRAGQIDTAEHLDESTKQQLRDLYRQALEELRRGNESRSKADEFERTRQDAPKLLESIRAQLAEAEKDSKLEIPESATLSELEQRLSLAEAQLFTAQKGYGDLEAEPKWRADRRAELLASIPNAQQRLAEVSEKLSAATDPNEHPEVSAARRALLNARKMSIEAELGMQEREVLSYDARVDLLRSRRELAARRVAEAQRLVNAWQEVVNDRRREEADRQAREARVAAVRSHPALRDLAEENAALADRRTGADGLAARIEQVARESGEASASLAKLEKAFKEVGSRVDAAGLTNAVGLLLRKERSDLPNVRQHKRSMRLRQQRIASGELERLDLEEQYSELVTDTERKTQQILAGLAGKITEDDREVVEGAVAELLETRKAYLAALMNDYEQYIRKLIDLAFIESQLIMQTEEFTRYINERVLWIRSTTPPRARDINGVWEGLRWLTGRESWSGLARSLWADIRNNLLLLFLAVLVVTTLLATARRLAKRIKPIGEDAAERSPAKFSDTGIALLLTLMRSVSWPFLMWVAGWRLSAQANSTEFTAAWGTALQTTSLVYLATELLRQLCRRDGLGQVHFRWDHQRLDRISRHLLRFMVVFLPLVLLVSLLEHQDDETLKHSLGRLIFIMAQALIGIAVYMLLHPKRGLLSERLTQVRTGWLFKMRTILFVLAIGGPIVLAVLAWVGYYYTALQLAWRLVYSALLVLGVLIVNGLLVRWLWLAQWKLAVDEARKRERELRERVQETDSPPHDVPTEQDDEVNVFVISAQTRQLMRFFTAFAVLAGLWLIWVDVLPALAILRNVGLPYAPSVTAADIVLAVIIVCMTIVAVRNIPGLLEVAVFQRLPLQAGEVYAIRALSRYAMTIVGVIAACAILGVTWSKVQWLIAAMTVGLGFGLQEIFGNFVSGLIILFERPIRVGDKVTIGDISGTVSRIRIRATTVTDFNRKELIVPNKEFVTGKLINWTLSDRTLRIVLPVGVAYGSDTELARRLLLSVAKENKTVLPEPESEAHFLAFGDSSLQLELWVFVQGLENFIKARDELHTAIAKTFREAGIEIAFPQRDIHLRSIRQAIPISSQKEDR